MYCAKANGGGYYTRNNMNMIPFMDITIKHEILSILLFIEVSFCVFFSHNFMRYNLQIKNSRTFAKEK